MKKIFTLLFTTAMLTSAFAQYGSRDGKGYGDKKDVAVNDHKFDRDDNKFGNGSYYFTAREKDMAIAKINREYDNKIQAVKSKFFLNWFQKKRQIDNLQDQRKMEINMVLDKFNDRRNQFDDRGRDKRKHW